MRKRTKADLTRVRQVLADLAFPAAKWQIVIHAEDYGADTATRSDLWTLPSGTFADLASVLAALDRGPAQAPAGTGYRAAPGVQAAGREVRPR